MRAARITHLSLAPENEKIHQSGELQRLSQAVAAATELQAWQRYDHGQNEAEEWVFAQTHFFTYSSTFQRNLSDYPRTFMNMMAMNHLEKCNFHLSLCSDESQLPWRKRRQSTNIAAIIEYCALRHKSNCSLLHFFSVLLFSPHYKSSLASKNKNWKTKKKLKQHRKII